MHASVECTYAKVPKHKVLMMSVFFIKIISKHRTEESSKERKGHLI